MQNLNKINPTIWDNHYTKEKSKLVFPDENLVRILSRIPVGTSALDHGAGSGRHSVLLKSYGYQVTACDYSAKAIEGIQKMLPTITTNVITSTTLPYEDKSFDLVVSWGVLHYNSFDEANTIISEIKRILKPNGYIVGTVRSNLDTHLKTKDGVIGNKDLSGGKVTLYSLDELKDMLKIFKDTEFGYMERTPMGKLEERICHWIFQAKN
ncbi:MAG TPA: class I SAM-dependent methyltransferase [Leptospiraceae bacterium]|nr:class I SAM-dependent methyltransferase [Leptospiraceae bacterium]HMW04320.1 class I SAM-dependent methyltransferase [Leptospiraceae bacterium]HMX30666.1 class I SAM-dependent methyltransferase [Leptospiraceae bacterium]HMY31366.1 class I SAM-dependent methyltransferase [Leptospiraceae bacterium]HMZ65375.1 class I SAM-dependent methyltransferase [Leptospiraceae bacterium]